MNIGAKEILKEMVMLRIRPEQFCTGTTRKLYTRNMGSFKILKWLNPMHMPWLPTNVGFSSTVNVEDFSHYHKPISIIRPISTSIPLPLAPFPLPSISNILRKKEKIEQVLDNRVIITWSGNSCSFRMKWAFRPNEEVTWISEHELQDILPSLYKEYINHNPLELDFS